MAGFARIKITFTDDMERTDRVNFFYHGANKMQEIWVTQRNGPNQVTIGDPTGNAGEISAINYRESLLLDYGYLPFTITQIGNEVTIIANDPTHQFVWDSSRGPVTYIIDNTTEPLLTIDSTSFSTTGRQNKCTNIKVTVNTNIVADKILAPIIVDPNTNNPFSFDESRGGTIYIKVQTEKGQVAEKFLEAPDFLTSDIISVNVTNGMTGATAIVNVAHNGIMNLEYSLDDVTFTTSNVFTGLPDGGYEVYVRDQFGCKTSKFFKVISQGQVIIKSPFFYLPTANSIRFANRVTWGDCSNYKNDYNTLSCEVDVPLPKQEIQQFQTCDIITTQFKSNYTTHLIGLKNLTDNIAIPRPVIKKTDFIGRKDKRDAKLYSLSALLGAGKIGVYFIAGDTYDYDLGTINGDYALYGGLPEWGKSGNSIQLPNGEWYLIEDVVYIEEKSADMLVISAPLINTEVIVASFYNLHEFDVFEFTVDFSAYQDKKMQISINATDIGFDAINFLSEIIDVRVRHKGTIELRYWDDENTDMFFSTGIINKMRLMREKEYGQPAGSIESYDTDTDTLLISADIRQKDVFLFSPVTKSIMWKIDEAASHRFVTIDGVRYGEKQIEVSEALEETNLYDITLTMKKASAVFRGSGLQFDDSGVEIPALIETGSGFVKYQ